MRDEEFRAIVAQGPCVVLVEKGHMLALLDARAALARMLDRAVSYIEISIEGSAFESAEEARAYLAQARAALGQEPVK